MGKSILDETAKKTVYDIFEKSEKSPEERTLSDFIECIKKHGSNEEYLEEISAGGYKNFFYLLMMLGVPYKNNKESWGNFEGYAAGKNVWIDVTDSKNLKNKYNPDNDASIIPLGTRLNKIYEMIEPYLNKAKEKRKGELEFFLGGNHQGEKEMSNQGDDTTMSNSNYINSIVSEAIENNSQVIFTGAPGTGKTYSVLEYVKEQTKDDDKKRYDFVQFHPSYDYSDFVEGLRPVEKDGKVSFVRMDGTFKAFCRKIVNDNQKNTTYYFIIDEINRADLSKVFGELMFGLEESYRGSENPFKTQYSNLKTYELDDEGNAKPMKSDCFKDGFYIPKNLKIIGTMNDIDRSVEAFDFALRRRFRWIDIKANDIMKKSLEEMLDEVPSVENIIAMNNKMSENSKLGLTEAYHIGPAYFKDYDGDNLEEIWEQKIEPILREYTRGRNTKDVGTLIGECKSALFHDQNNNAAANATAAAGANTSANSNTSANPNTSGNANNNAAKV